jgi:hypothetical protein
MTVSAGMTASSGMDKCIHIKSVRACFKSSFIPLNELLITGSYEAVLQSFKTAS